MIKLLNPNKALYSKYMDENFIDKYLKPHLHKKFLLNKCYNLVKYLIHSIREYILIYFNKSTISFIDVLKKLFKNSEFTHNYTVKLSRAITMEIWFQQVFNGKYKNFE